MKLVVPAALSGRVRYGALVLVGRYSTAVYLQGRQGVEVAVAGAAGRQQGFGAGVPWRCVLTAV